MKRLLICLSLVLGGAFLATAQESVSLAVPIVKTTTSSCGMSYMNLDVTNGRVMVVLACNNGDTITKTYDSTSTPTGATLLHTLNTANFSGTTSLIKAVYNRLISDGVIAGTVSGTPQH